MRIVNFSKLFDNSQDRCNKNEGVKQDDKGPIYFQLVDVAEYVVNCDDQIEHEEQ